MLNDEQRSFLISFFPLFIGLYLLLHLLPLEFVNAAIASFQYSLLQWIGIAAQVKGSLILTHNADFRIIIDCSGLVMSSLFAALVLSTPVRNKIRTLLIGIPSLLVINQLRLLATMLVGVHYGVNALDIAHVALWFFDGGLVLALWYVLLPRLEKRSPRALK